MKNIDDLIRSGETQKELHINDALWHRLEEKLDQKDSTKKRRWLSWSIAASILLIMAASASVLLKTNDTYVVEDMVQLNNPVLNAQVINTLHQSYPTVLWDLNG